MSGTFQIRETKIGLVLTDGTFSTNHMTNNNNHAQAPRHAWAPLPSVVRAAEHRTASRSLDQTALPFLPTTPIPAHATWNNRIHTTDSSSRR